MIDSSFDVLLDYHDCPVCGAGQLIEMRCDDPAHAERCPDRACLVCGTAVFLDPALIWPTEAEY